MEFSKRREITFNCDTKNKPHQLLKTSGSTRNSTLKRPVD
jgi:hypothetical protein